MSRCFSVTNDEIRTGSDYVTAKRRKNIYRTMHRSLHSPGNAKTAYLADNRNYRVKQCSNVPHTDCLAQSQSYYDYLNMVRGRMYVNPKLVVPGGSKYNVSLSSMLQRYVDPSVDPQVMTKTLTVKDPGTTTGASWALPYIRNTVGLPPDGEDYDNFFYTGYPATIVDPKFQFYRDIDCNESRQSLKLNLYGVPCANASTYRYYQIAQSQPSSGVMFPSPVSFGNLGPEVQCAPSNPATWGKGAPICNITKCGSNPAPDQLEQVEDKKPC